jgi:Ca2+-binding RTX toxin-like protein
MTTLATPASAQAPVGQGFTVTAADLSFILDQVKIAEHHVARTTPATGPCGALVGTAPFQIPSPLVSKGLRTVDGSCNNLVAGKDTSGATGQLFPRLATPSFSPAGPVPAGFGPPGQTSYAQKSGNVFDTEPRVVSNLVVDQTSTNPAAVAAAGFPVRTQGNEGVVPCTDPANTLPAGCVPAGETLFIPNVTTDVGLSPPFNSLFTIFGQFFDHGVDQTVKGGGTVFVPLKADDPLITVGPDGKPSTGDEVTNPALQFMVLTRARVDGPGPDGIRNDNPATDVNEAADNTQEATNTDSPWVDQSQTYTSHPAHQAYLREYRAPAPGGRPGATGKLIHQTDSGMGTWAMVKAQAATVLGLRLTDPDVFDIPLIATDAYGNFIPGPARGMAQYVTRSGLVEGNTAGGGVAVPADVLRFDIPFLTDIAHNAEPKPGLTPDTDTTASADFAAQPAGTYDDEMLNAHFIAGDGRVNENIGLTAVHQIFHSEHDRLADAIQATLNEPANASLKASYAAVDTTATDDTRTFNLGERIFQAARFVTEMEYQHLVFEEFARKVQPAINPFEPFAFTQTDLNPAVRAEFAHAVYRFGHSMLTETIPRHNEDGAGPDNVFGTADDVLGSENEITLLDAFLNPPEYNNGGPAGHLNSKQAGSAILMGLSDQTGSEIDEFVTDTLRNNLLGLPLDLPTLNMARARSEGVPPLNVFRRQLFAATNDGQLAPYISWIDFGENLKHPESLINFVAAYGQHPTILADAGPDNIVGNGDDGPATLASRREAARLIVSPDSLAGESGPPDAAEFMNSTGAWANDGTASKTGLDKVDLWAGGLAETTFPFGGLLGSTFNFVFENQLTDLQNGDRLYYLARTPGMNLRQQLEGNSFAELVMRNTTAHTLKADAFATSDCKFELKKLAGTSAGFTQFGNTVANDPDSTCNETALLIRMPDGTIQYRARNSLDPSGINGQSVYNGIAGVDRIFGGNDNDTFWGNEGNDRIEGGSGADVALGGDGNDILTDLGGDDVSKGGPGNDAIDGGPGLDIIISGAGKDFTNGGANANETFGGEGDDFIMLGQSLDAAFGDSGDDWQEGGDQPDLLQGDSGNLFFLDDSNKPGHDIFIGQGGDDDYDMEGGDDIGVAGQGIEKVAGASGFDWQIGQGEETTPGVPAVQKLDLDLPLVGLDTLPVDVRDKFSENEALSGWNANDEIRGDSVIPAQHGGAGFIGCDVLDQAGLDRIAGLDPLIPDLNVVANGVVPLADVVDNSAAKSCPILTGPNVWGAGNVLLGGNGSDLIEGRGADDVIDGDKYLNVRLSVRTDPADPATEIGTTDLMETVAKSGNFGANTAGKTLQESVFAGLVDPGNIVAVREIHSPATLVGTDTAVFSGPRADYDVTLIENNTAVTVAHTRGAATDGIDTVRNVEKLQFTDQTVNALPNRPGTPGATLFNLGTNPAVPGGPARLAPQEAVPVSVNTAAIVDPDGTTGSTFTFQWQQRLVGAANFANVATNGVAGRGTTQSFTPLPAAGTFPGEVGRELRVVITYTDALGNPETVTSAPAIVGDLFQGGAGNDTFTGTASEDTAKGAGGNDTLTTNDGNDLVSGDAGDDTLSTGNGDDVIDVTGTGDGFDAVSGGAGTDKLVARANGTVIGLRGATALQTVEQVNANGFTGVTIQGSPAADTLSFTTVTLNGIVSIDGGAGDDVMNGSAGNDTFRFSTGMGNDRINGFEANPAGGQDLLNISGLGVTTANFTQRVTIAASGANTLITVRSAPGGTVLGTITLLGVTPGAGVNQISQTDFVPVP